MYPSRERIGLWRGFGTHPSGWNRHGQILGGSVRFGMLAIRVNIFFASANSIRRIMMTRTRLLIMAVCLASVSSLARADDKIDPASMKKTESGLKYQDLKEGTGAKPNTGQTCEMHYTGWLWEDGKKGKKFDSSVDRGQTFEFPIGARRVIKGWDEGVATMKVGGKRLLLIPAELAYGERGAGGAIPPGATLLFEVELISVK